MKWGAPTPREVGGFDVPGRSQWYAEPAPFFGSGTRGSHPARREGAFARTPSVCRAPNGHHGTASRDRDTAHSWLITFEFPE